MKINIAAKTNPHDHSFVCDEITTPTNSFTEVFCNCGGSNVSFSVMLNNKIFFRTKFYSQYRLDIWYYNE